ncbi:Carbon catabolite repressor protein 4 like 6 [Glycine soja]|uniref:Carbon catabolite repressor protein 4 like 6 n=1 Tax=Glycine soja TaxID=3848 RepID=A0A0B2PGA8_GLYSO|nr:Carbon catabolite repressor protein 4 like 6 [Glycine soja]
MWSLDRDPSPLPPLDNESSVDLILKSTKMRSGNPVDGCAIFWHKSSLTGSSKVVVCNIHVLYNPNRGEIKLGQVRVLLDKAKAVYKLWNDTPVVICGDFNCTPKSPLYNFISEQKIETATGNAECTFLEHPLLLRSTYTEAMVDLKGVWRTTFLIYIRLFLL